MGFWSSVASGISSIVSGIGNAIKTVGKAIVDTAVSFVKMKVEVFKKVLEVIHDIAVSLGLIEVEDTAEEIGAKTEVADKNREEFDSNKEYLEYLRKDVELPKDYIKQMSVEEKKIAEAKGAAVISGSISEELGIEVEPSFWGVAAYKGLSSEETRDMIDKFKVHDIETGQLSEYADNKLDPELSQNISDVLRESFADSGMSPDEANEKIIDIKQGDV